MIARYRYRGLAWIDLESPTKDELDHIREEFGIPEFVADELQTSSLRSKADLYENFIYLIFHFPTLGRRDDTESKEQEIDFIVGKEFIITTRYNTIDPLKEFSKMFERDALSNDQYRIEPTAGLLFIEMIRQLYRASLRELDDLVDVIKDIETGIFKGEEQQMVRTISETSRKLLDFKRSIRFHHDILSSYELASKRFFGDQYPYYLTQVFSEYNKVNDLLESNRDTLAELQRTNDSLLSTKQNNIMKKFTIISFVTFPLMLVTGIFGMNVTDDIIFIRSHSDFFFVIGAMLLTSLTMFIFFRYEKWL